MFSLPGGGIVGVGHGLSLLGVHGVAGVHGAVVGELRRVVLGDGPRVERPGSVGGPEDVGGGGLGGGAHPRHGGAAAGEELHEVGLGEAGVEGGL